ncbi:MAG TPA: acyl-CoA dehydrogenase family protein [Acidimicrobiales bacterium]|nr:acyl-CoA dehydrogenase family protein [Acidimicrobiales bacterium]
MHLEFTDEQLELRDSARAILARECPPRLVRDIAAGGPGLEELATAFTWLGWPALTIEVDLGGLGRSFVELAMLLEELGRAAAPGPFLPTQALFAPVVREAGTTAQAHRFLAGVAAGASTGTLALHEGGRWDPLTVVATAERDGDGWLLRGHKQHVMGAPEVDEVVVAARRDSGTLGLFVVPAAELTFKRTTSLDPTRSLANVELNGVWVPEARMLGEPDVDAGKALEVALCDATVALALDGLGACAALFDSCLAAAHDGRIAHVGQATEHALAAMLVSIEMSRALIYQAACAVTERDAGASRMASAAKAAMGECQRLVAGTCLELYGTPIDRDARDLRLWVGRAKADDLLFGSAGDHRRMIADQLLSARRARASQLATALVH